MDRDTAQKLLAACEQTAAGLAAAEEAVRGVDDQTERSELLGSLATVTAHLFSGIRASVVRQHPDLVAVEAPGEPDVFLDEGEQQAVASLEPEQVVRIDQALLQSCSTQWRKVARVVGATQSALAGEFPELPAGFCAQRIAELVACGHLESQGSLQHMRFSEVRVARRQPGAA